ncbi:MAG: hypothetical protein ACE144_08985 [Thermodesulfobacteriota bacterium]
MKRILTILFLLAILPVPLLAQEKTYLEFEFVKFFEGPYVAPSDAQREYKAQFPKSSTRYVFFLVGAKNLLYNNRAHRPEIVGRYYKPDGSFHGEGKVNVDIPPDWEKADLWGGWGWDKAGNWSVGTYRVEILFGNVKVAEASFSIYDDRASTTTPPVSSVPSEKVYLEYRSVKFFESGATEPPASQREFKTDFPKSTTRYVYFLVETKNLLYRNRAHKPLVFGKYYNPDGSLRGEAKVNVDIPSDWEDAELWNAWGWEKPGNWPVGTYRVEIWFGSSKVGEGSFSIYDDRASTTTPPVSSVSSVPPVTSEKAFLEFQSVTFFESGATDPPASERQFKTDFSRTSTRYINFFVLAKNLLYRNRSQKPLVRGRYYYPDGSFMGEATVNVEIPSTWQDTNLWAGWGWDKPGNWSIGTYRLDILFGDTKVGEGRFSISDDRK